MNDMAWIGYAKGEYEQRSKKEPSRYRPVYGQQSTAHSAQRHDKENGNTKLQGMTHG
jgi:hypothetical protein